MKRSEMTPDERDAHDLELMLRSGQGVKWFASDPAPVMASQAIDPYAPAPSPPPYAVPMRNATGRILIPIPKNQATIAGIKVGPKISAQLATCAGTPQATYIIDTLSEASWQWEQLTQHVPPGEQQRLKEALLYIITEKLSLIHPHDNCPYCRTEQKMTATATGPEPNEVELFTWLMDNWSESKQNIVARLKRDFVITKKGS